MDPMVATWQSPDFASIDQLETPSSKNRVLNLELALDRRVTTLNNLPGQSLPHPRLLLLEMRNRTHPYSNSQPSV